MSNDSMAMHHACIRGTRSFGVIITMTPENFMNIITKQDNGLVVMAVGGFFKTYYRYLTSYKGLVFFTKSSEKLVLPSTVEIIPVNKLRHPDEFGWL